jgi:hypothetical protein
MGVEGGHGRHVAISPSVKARVKLNSPSGKVKGRAQERTERTNQLRVSEALAIPNEEDEAR